MTRTDALTAGQTVIMPEHDHRDMLLPITPEHPGTVHVIASVGPFVLTAGPKAGQVAKAKGGVPLIRVEMFDGLLLSMTASQDIVRVVEIGAAA